jgi:hypothetical protein
VNLGFLRTLFLLFLFICINVEARLESVQLKLQHHKQEILIDGLATATDDDWAQIESELIHKIHSQKKLNKTVKLQIEIDENFKTLLEDSQSPLSRMMASLEREATLSIKFVPRPKKDLQKFYAKLKKSMLKNYRWTFALVRGSFQTSVAFMSLRISDGSTPWPISLAMGAWVGLLSGNVQFFAKTLYGWMTTRGGLGSALTRSLATFGLKLEDDQEKQLKSICDWVEQFGRWYAFEVLFMAVLKTGWTFMGHSQDFGPAALNVLSTAAMATFAQGSWDLSFTTRAENRHLLGEDRASILLKSTFGLLGASMISTGILTVLRMINYPHAEWAFGVMGAAGFYSLWQATRASKKAHKELRTADNSCEFNLIFR